MEGYSIRWAKKTDLKTIEHLLQNSSLPTVGLSLASAQFLLAETKANEVIGVLGAQHNEAATLFRSFAVISPWRGKGVGMALVKTMLNRLQEQNRTVLYLLTETAASYFEGLGFQFISREEIPQILLVQSGLDQACPCSSQCMKLEVRSSSKEKIRTYALSQGAHIAGFASAADFAEAPAGFRPTDIMPKAKTVMVLGKALSKGTVLSANKAVYTMQGATIIQELDALAQKVVFHLEEQGALSLAIPADAPYFHWEEERQHGMGILSHRHAAVKAGLGSLGKNSMLLTPKYGNRITLVTILTELELLSDPPYTETLCPDECRRCVDACPTTALNGQAVVEQKRCRSHVGTVSDRGHELTNCWNCRLACAARF